MKPWMILVLAFFSLGAHADPLVLVNTLSDRPVFTLQSGGWTQSRTVSPGNRVSMEPGLFSGLGEKKIPLAGGTIYYLARFGATPGIYRLAADQVLILNQSGRAVPFTIQGSNPTAGYLANGSFALGAAPAEETLAVEWDDGTGNRQNQSLERGTVYRLLLGSPEGTGVTVVLSPWD